ncbi:MAG: hypothetical protein ABI837_14525, partial [Acidobacteriota bacterium]
RLQDSVGLAYLRKYDEGGSMTEAESIISLSIDGTVYANLQYWFPEGDLPIPAAYVASMLAEEDGPRVRLWVGRTTHVLYSEKVIAPLRKSFE